MAPDTSTLAPRAGDTFHPGQPLREIRPTRGWRHLGLRELWAYRELVGFLALRNVKVQYRQMALGPTWLLLQPLASAAAFTIVFGKMAKLPSQGVPYLLFTFSAIALWQFFAGALQSSVGSLVQQMGVISKVYFPRLVVPTAAVGSELVTLFPSLAILGALAAFYRVSPSPRLALLPLFLVGAAATALAVGLWGATFAVRFRDVRFATRYGLQLWMYATPVAYSAEIVPVAWRPVYELNPMYWMVEGFRWSLLGIGRPPGIGMLFPLLVVALLLVSGLAIFRRTERTIVDLL